MHQDGKPRRLLDQVRDEIRTRHYSIRTEEAYLAWIRRYILFYGNEGNMPHETVMRSIELLGTKVIPALKEE